ncbi:MAG: Gfo/Idh/MocA family oxidoreductase [Clostridia bacterium]|nr:Gfo/Idh/MocA family oxidoreductase [Clostridia bacterium]
MKKVALWGVWHVHAGHFVDMASRYGEVVGVWEDNREWQAEFCRKHNLYAYSSLDEMLTSDVEGVIVCTETSRHKEVILKLIEAGKHIFTEKVLAITDEDANEIARAVKASGLLFAICFPNIAYSFTQTIKEEILKKGELGKINSVRFRYSHTAASEDELPPHFYDRETAGGGALIDHGVHGLSVIYHLFGLPARYKSMISVSTANKDSLTKNKDMVEDNSFALMGYDNGLIAMNECSSVASVPLTIEISGEKGSCRFTCDRLTKNIDSIETEVEQTKYMFHPLKQFMLEDIDPAFGVDTGVAVTYMVNRLYENQ